MKNCIDCRKQKKADNCQACYLLEKDKAEKTRIAQENKYHSLAIDRGNMIQEGLRALEKEQKKYMQFRSDILAILNTTQSMSLAFRMKEYFKTNKNSG